MIPLKTILYLFLLSGSMLGSVVYHPLIGLIGYIFTYNINPIGQWWGSTLVEWGVRYSLFLALATGLGMVLHRGRVRFKSFFEVQEILLIIFVGLIWLSILLGLGFNEEETNVLKMTKVMIILLMASHVITDLKKYEMMIWTLIIAGLYLGVEAYNAPDWMFQGGRFDRGIGGSDFAEGNFLGAHFGMLLPFIGVMFLKGGWKSKIICLISAVFVTNSVILCRSRGVFLAVLAGVVTAIIYSIPRSRSKLMFWLSVAIVGALILTDPGFWSRMGEIGTNLPQKDTSTQGRVLAWEAAISMTLDNPLGVGEGNFKKYVGVYNRTIVGKDTHNTYLRCIAELGILGFIVFLLLIINAFRILSKIRREGEILPNGRDFLWHVYAVKVALVIYLVCGMSMTHTYIEELYWLFFFPVFLKRSVENQKESSIGIVTQKLAGGIQQI
jgi:putative inorganic carbon (HCO3(-)) transporter